MRMHLVVRHADRLGEVAEQVAGRRARHRRARPCRSARRRRSVPSYALRSGDSMRPSSPKLRADAPHRDEVAPSLRKLRTYDLSSSMPRSPISTRFGTREVLVELVELVLPAARAGDARIHRRADRSARASQCVSRLMQPTLPFASLGDGLGDRVRAWRRILADHDRDGAAHRAPCSPSPRRQPARAGCSPPSAT